LSFVRTFAGSYVRWGYNKPNNFGGYQTCGVMQSGLDYRFDDDSCGKTTASYVCEIRKQASGIIFFL